MRAAIYCRVPEGDEAETKLAVDLAECRARIQSEGWLETDVYVDRGGAGKEWTQPELGRLRADARAGLFDRVVVPHASRIQRNLSGFLSIRDELRAVGIEIVGVEKGEYFGWPLTE